VPDESKTQSNDSRREFALGLVVIAALIFAVFWPAMHSPLAFDDLASVRYVKSFQSWTNALGHDVCQLFRPVKNLEVFLILKAGGALLLWHLVNLAAYAAAAAGVATLVRRLTYSTRWGLAGGALWAFSATGVTVAVWASCFNISVAIAAATCAVAIHARNAERDRGYGWQIAAAVCWLLSLFSYETAVAAAPLIVLLDWFMGRRVFSKEALIRYGFFGIVGVCWMILRLKSGAETQGLGNNPGLPPDMPRWQLAVSAPYFLWTHLLMWAAPSGRIEFLSSYVWNTSVPAVVHPFCWLMLIGVVLAIVGLKKRSPLAAFGLAWFIVGSIPSGNFVPLGNTPFADYYVPFPSVGLVIVLVVWVRALWALRHDDALEVRSRQIAMGMAVALIAARAAQLPTLWSWIDFWKTPTIAISEAYKVRPAQFLAGSLIATAMFECGEYELAEKYASEAARDAPHLAAPRLVLGDCAIKKGHREEAIAHFEAARSLMAMDTQTATYCQLRLAELYGQDKAEFTHAMDLLMPVLKQSDSAYHEEAVITAVDALELNGLHDKAVINARKGLTFHPTSAGLKSRLDKLTAASPGPP